MNQVQSQFCTSITKKINDFPMARYFAQPVDPKIDGVADYFDKIKKPMDLGTVLQNLHDNKYLSVDQWKNDMNLIWKNAMTYNGPGYPLYIIAQDLQDTFRKMTETIPRTHTIEWLMKVRKEHLALQRIIMAKPNDDASKGEQSGNSTPQSKPRIILKPMSKSL